MSCFRIHFYPSNNLKNLLGTIFFQYQIFIEVKNKHIDNGINIVIDFVIIIYKEQKVIPVVANNKSYQAQNFVALL